jgi:hypothetical protein
VLTLTGPPLEGDYNLDGTVDAADYVVWRKNDGTQSGYDIWRANFGKAADGGAALPSANPLPAAAPESVTLVMMLIGILPILFLRRTVVS